MIQARQHDEKTTTIVWMLLELRKLNPNSYKFFVVQTLCIQFKYF